MNIYILVLIQCDMKKLTRFLIGLLVVLLFALPLFFHEKEKKSAAVKVVEACEAMINVEGQANPMPLEEYVLGVVAAEMPISFHEEALKAQAIAARTYVLKTTNGGQDSISPTVLRQVFIDKEQRMSKWGEYFPGNESKLEKIIEETRGRILNYKGELITAMFHSMSNGQTESSEGYSGNEVSYLSTVDSEWDKNLPNFTQAKVISLRDWQLIFGSNFGKEDFTGLVLERNESNRVARMVTEEKVWEGREVRELLDLRSTDFDVTFDSGKELVTIITRGYGHGVGMSQYGADAMAQIGESAESILKHYYQDIEINVWNGCLK